MADLVNIQLNTKWLTLGVRVTTFHVMLGGAIAAGVLYLVQELERVERGSAPERSAPDATDSSASVSRIG